MSDTPFNNVAFDMPKTQSNSIKVIGVGGGGSNAVNHMFAQDIKGVDFVICNTDAQALQNSAVPNKIQLGVTLTSGLGAGANPEVGERAAKESVEEIENMLTSHTKMVFITAGMGGGTGTGAAPVIAGVAKNMGILTVGIVTMPFQFEGRMRSKQAQKGIDELRNNVDSLIVINNNKLREVYGNLGFKAGFAKADEVLSTASRGIAEVITHHYKQNIDLHDAKTVLSNSGTAIMGSAKETGESRAKNAIMKALDSPLLNDNKIRGAKNVLLLIVSGTDEVNEVTLDEIGEINDFIQEEAGYDANIIMGVGEDDDLGDAIAVTVVATGFAIDQQRSITNTEVKKVYHTLNTEQTAHYSFDEEETAVRPKTARILEEPLPVKEEKVIHQLIDEEPDFFKSTLKNNTTSNIIETTEAVVSEEVQADNQSTESIEEVSEEDFVITDITQNLFSDVDEVVTTQVNVFDLPVSEAESIRKKEAPLNVSDLPVIDAELINYVEEVPDAVDLTKENTKDVVLEDKEEVVERTVFVLEDDEEPEVSEPVKEVSKPQFKTETLDGVTKHTLEDFDFQPTIKNSSSIKVDRKVAQIVVNEPEEITLTVKKETDLPHLTKSVKEDKVSPLNFTISELQKTTEKRKNTFKKYSHRFKHTAFNEDIIEDIEKVPAYKRLGVELHDKKDVDNKSRTSIDVTNNEVTIRKNNSFLHDNVD